AAFINQLGSHWVRWSHLDPLVGPQFFQRDEPLPFSSLNRHSTTPFVGQKIFQRAKQIRTKSPLFLTDSVQISVLQKRREKTLSEVLSVRWPNPLSPDEAINRSPIHAAKFFERSLCRGRFPLCLQHHAPMRGCKRDASVSANPGQ